MKIKLKIVGLFLCLCLLLLGIYFIHKNNSVIKLRELIENNIDAYTYIWGEIIKITPHPKIKNLYILQTSTEWWDSVYLIEYSENTIHESSLIIYGECKTIANFIFLEGLNDYYIEFYYSTHQGNGGYMLYNPKSKTLLIDIYGVLDYGQESKPYKELIERFGSGEYSFVFEDQFLRVTHKDISGNGYTDLVFSGKQNIINQNGDLLCSSKCKIVYLYSPDDNIFILDTDKCIFPQFWEYNWNAIK